MLRSLRDLEKYTVRATDGDIGDVVNFMFDDERWAVRYLVVDSGGFFEGRRMLISPISFRDTDWGTRRFNVALTKEKVRGSPGVDSDLPVSRQHERDYLGYYGYPAYWGGTGMWGIGAYPGLLASSQLDKATEERRNPNADLHLRSANEVRGYDIQGNDGGIGHVDDFIVDDETWALRYLVVDTSNWWFGKKVLIAPDWATNVSWGQKKVFVNATRQQIKDSPEWSATAPVNRAYEVRLYDYYGRPVYWDDPRAEEVPPVTTYQPTANP